MKAINFKLFVFLTFLQAPFLHAEEVLSGEGVADVVVGNTVQMEFRDAQDNFRTRTFHEYYDPDGSIYGMTKYREQQGNNKIKPLSGNDFELLNEGGKIRNVKVYEGKHHGLE